MPPECLHWEIVEKWNGVFHAPSRRMVSHTQKQRAWFSGCHFCESSEHYVIVILISSLVKMKIN